MKKRKGGPTSTEGMALRLVCGLFLFVLSKENCTSQCKMPLPRNIKALKEPQWFSDSIVNRHFAIDMEILPPSQTELFKI